MLLPWQYIILLWYRQPTKICRHVRPLNRLKYCAASIFFDCNGWYCYRNINRQSSIRSCTKKTPSWDGGTWMLVPGSQKMYRHWPMGVLVPGKRVRKEGTKEIQSVCSVSKLQLRAATSCAGLMRMTSEFLLGKVSGSKINHSPFKTESTFQTKLCLTVY